MFKESIQFKLLIKEAIAKLLCFRNSMILLPETYSKLSGVKWLARFVPTRTCPNGRQKGDFMRRISFAIASKNYLRDNCLLNTFASNRRLNFFSHLISSSAIGLELENEEVKYAYLSMVKGKVKIEKLDSFSVHKGEKEVQKLLDKNLTVSGLHSSDLLIRLLEIKLTKEKDLQSVLAFQAEPHIPFPIENALLQSMTISKTQNSTLCILLACRKDRIKSHLDTWNKFSIEPEILSCVPMALNSFSSYFSPCDPQQLQSVLHFNSKEITCILTQQGKLLASHCFMSHSKFANLEIMKTLTAFLKQYKTKNQFNVLITGNPDIIPNIIETLSQAFQLQIHFPKSSNSYTAEQIQQFAVPIGLALQATSKDTPIDFRKQEFVRSFPWKRMKTTTVLYLSLSFFIGFLLFYVGNLSLTHQEDHLRQEYINLLAFSPKPIQEMTPISIQQLTLEEITNRLTALKQAAQPSPDLFPLQPNIPLVSDVLAWLSTHPQIIQNQEGALKIENFTYVLMKRPDKNKKQEKYQVKVELEFTTPIPKFAREFHDALITPNQMVDPKNEIKWHAARDRYRTSFFLKDKTQYSTGG